MENIPHAPGTAIRRCSCPRTPTELIVEAVTAYLGRRLTERERALSGDVVAPSPALAPARTEPAPETPSAVPAPQQAPQPRRHSRGDLLFVLLMGMIIGAAGLYGAPCSRPAGGHCRSAFRSRCPRTARTARLVSVSQSAVRRDPRSLHPAAGARAPRQGDAVLGQVDVRRCDSRPGASACPDGGTGGHATIGIELRPAIRLIDVVWLCRAGSALRPLLEMSRRRRRRSGPGRSCCSTCGAGGGS